jgi:hypothetical protein
MTIRWNAFSFLVVALFLAAVAAGPAQTTPVIQRQDTNVTGVVAELTQCMRKDGVLSINVRLHNTSSAQVEFKALDHKNYASFYLTAENKKYFILSDSEKVPLAVQPNTYDGNLVVKIAAGGSYQW